MNHCSQIFLPFPIHHYHLFMKVSYLQPTFTAGPHIGQNTASTIMDDVDDMDIDLGPTDEGEAFQLVNMPQISVGADDTNPIEQEPDQSTLSITTAQNYVGDRAQVSIADSDSLAPHKIHIRGVDDFTTEDLIAFTSEHLPFETPTQIEWIDDTSANIVFNTPATALKALEQFTYISFGEPFSVPALQLRPAKILSKYPQSSLQVRLALSDDRKRPRAYEASRFYMMHPEHDPREQRRHDRSREDGPNDYRRRRYGHDEHRRRKNGDSAQGFKPSMYDDDASALASRENGNTSRRGSFSMNSTLSSDERSGGERHTRHTHYGDSYRPGRHDRSGGTSRDRSASPGRVKAYTPNHSKRMSRRRTPPPPYQTRDPHPIPLQNEGKELFSSKSALDTVSNGTGMELFPHKTMSTNLTRELFPNKSITINHRRSDAFDAADETADLFASRLSVPFTERENSFHVIKKTSAAPTSSFGRLRGSDLEPDSEALENLEDGGISIQGVSKKQDQGFSIRGAADDNARNGLVKELFPGKALCNAGKELFVEKIHGRGGRRNRAQDMFY